MEQGLGQDSIPASGSFDKSRVLNVKPLRSLVPIFPPSQRNQASSPDPQGSSSPFLCVSPTGPFPPGVTSFYPFSLPPESQSLPEQDSQHTPFGVPNQAGPFGFTNPVQTAVPISSFRTPQPPQNASAPGRYTRVANGDTGSSKKWSTKQKTHSHAAYTDEDDYSDSQNQSAQFLSGFSMHVTDAEETSKKGRRKGKPGKRVKRSQDMSFSTSDVDVDSIFNSLLTSFNLTAYDPYRRADGDDESVRNILMVYDLLRRKLTQIEETKDTKGRPDLRAGTILMTKGIRANSKKRIGPVPGVEVGDIFFFRLETCLVGLHAPCMSGIDYMNLKTTQKEDLLAVSIVSSGGYEDNVEDGDVLVYSGQGGNLYRKDKEVIDQKLVRGNLALEKSVHRANDVRVIRGIKDLTSPTGKVYVYDGLYKIQESWVEKGKSGCNVFKYKLIREPGQPEAYMIWKSIQQWKEGIISRSGVILPDLTSGAESLPVSLVNDVDDEKGPAYFTYIPSLKYSTPLNSAQSSFLCTCRAGCVSGDPHCSCVQRNGGYLPYLANGILVNQESLIHECGPSCSCPPNCRNRTTQGGPKVRLEVFKTKDKGWGLRSWDPIRSGSFICEYAGEVIDNSKADEFESNEDEFIFSSNRTYQPLEGLASESHEDPKIPFQITISAKKCGNVARFMNHSCYPNVLWQPILRANKYESSQHVAFFAIRHIPPMTELTYDYGIVQTDNANQRRKRCLCGSSNCRGYFF